MSTRARSRIRELRGRGALLCLASAALILGCGGDSTGPPPEPQPQPGQLQVTLSSGTAVGAVVLTVTGGTLSAPAAAAGATMYHDLSGNTLRAVVAGSSLSGTILRFSVPDVRQVASYTVSVEQAAGTTNQPVSPGGITVAVIQ